MGQGSSLEKLITQLIHSDQTGFQLGVGVCLTDGRRKLLFEHFWFLMGAGGWKHPGARAPWPMAMVLPCGPALLFPFFSPWAFLPSPFSPTPPLPFFLLARDAARRAGWAKSPDSVHSFDKRSWGSLAQDWPWWKPRGAARIWVPCSPEADSAPAVARPAHAAGRLSQRGHVMGDPEEGDGNWATGLRSP